MIFGKRFLGKPCPMSIGQHKSQKLPEFFLFGNRVQRQLHNSYQYEYTYGGSGNRLTMVQRDGSSNVTGQKSCGYDNGNKLTQEGADGATTS